MNDLKRKNIYNFSEIRESLKHIKLSNEVSIKDCKERKETNNQRIIELETKVLELEKEIIELKKKLNSQIKKDITYIS